MNMTKKEEREFRKYRLPLPMRFTSGLMAWVFFTVSIMPSHIVIASTYEQEIKKVEKTKTDDSKTVSKDLNAIAKAAQKSKSGKTSIPKVPVGLQNQATSQVLLKTCRQIQTNIAQKKETEKELEEIAKISENFEKIKLATITQMTAARSHLMKKKAPEKFIQRLDERRKDIVKNFNEFSRLINQVIKNKKDTVKLKEKVNNLIAFIENAQKKTIKRNHGNGKKLPRRSEIQKYPSHPGTSPYFQWPVLVASADDVISDLLMNSISQSVTGVPVAADLNSTPEISLDSEIIQLATDLDNDAVKIFEYVRNEFVYEPYFGSVKGAKRTLIEKAGNDMDLASLLMSLLRASNISCRYVFGTIEMPIEDAGKWVGVDEPNQIAKVFTANGIPVELIQGGGQVSALKLDHVWVKAYIDYFPYRGAVNEVADTWIEMDPSFKQNTFTDSRDIEIQVGLDPSTFLSNIKSRCTIDPDGDFAANVPEDYIIDGLFAYAEPIRSYLAANSLTTESVFRQRKVNEERFGIIPVADQYKITARGLSFSQLPSDLRYKIALTLKNPATGESFKYETSLPELAGKKIILSYKPATSADEQEIADNASTVDFPVYLISLLPELKVAGLTAKTGTPVNMGLSQELEILFTSPTGETELIRDEITAGSVNALVLNFQTTVAEILNKQKSSLDTVAGKLASGDLTNLTRDNTLGDVLNSIGLSYFHQVDRFNQITAGNLEVSITRKPSLVRVVWDLNVAEQFGLPFTASVDRIKIDVNRDVNVPVAIKTDNRNAENQFTFTSALTGTALEHNVLSQPFLTEAASTARVIQKANAENNKIYTVTAHNAETVLPLLNIPTYAKTDIANAVNAGMEVTISQNLTDINGIPYVAYIKRDIDTSASEFILDTIVGGEQINNSLKAADLLTFGNSANYLNIVKPMADWLNVAEESTTNAGLSYLPAIASINAWYKDRTELDPVTTIAAVIAVSGPITKVYNEPAILNVVTGEKLISPNSDGIKDAFTVQADITRGAEWTFEIKNNSDQVVFSETDTAAELNITFNQAIPDGSYSYSITANSGGVDASPVSGFFKVDASLPTAEITEPATSAVITQAFVITGSVDDLNFEGFTIKINSPPDNPEPLEVFSSDTVVNESSLFVLDTTQFTNGPVDIILTVNDKAGNISTVTRSVTVNNPIPDLTAPLVSLTAVNPDNNQQITEGATVASESGQVDITINASDNVSVDKIKLFMDNNLISENTASTTLAYQVQTYNLIDGNHSLTAKAYDPSGNEASTTPLNFVISSPISNFKVTPETATPGNSIINIFANLREAADWTLAFTGPSVISQITGTGTTVSGQLNASTFTDGNYTVKLTVDGMTETPELQFIIDLLEYSPLANIANISENQSITEGIFELKGTADDQDASDTLYYRISLKNPEGQLVKDLTPEPVNAQGWHEGRVPAGNSLAELDFTMTRNGTYTMLLEVTDGSGYASDSVTFALSSQLKVGQFAFSQQDMIIPVGGQPLSIIRTYNSLNASSLASSASDFGYGWTWSIKDIEMEINETRQTMNGEYGSVYVRTGGGRNVDITLPDGRRTTFTYNLRAGGGTSFKYYAEWHAAPGVNATLVPTGSNVLITLFNLPPYWEDGGLDTPMEYFDFPGFILTMSDGTQYSIDREDEGVYYAVDYINGGITYAQAYGKGTLKQIDQRSGDKIVFADSKIDHYNPAGEKTRSIVFQRDGNNRINAIFDPENLDALGNPVGLASVTYEYDATGNLIKVNKLIDKATSKYETTEFLYEILGRPHFISSIKDPRGLTPMISEFDDSGRLIATVDAFGNRIELEHNLAEKVETVYDRLGNPTIHGYDAKGNVVVTTNALGNSTQRTYDANNNETSITDALGNTTNFTYDSKSNRTSVTDPLGNTTNFTYDSYGNQLTVIDPSGNTTTNVYNANGNLVSSTNALGQSTSNSYNASGNLTSTTDANGTITANFEYDGSGNMTSTTDSAGVTRNFAYNSNGNQTGTSYSWTDPTGVLGTVNISTSTIYNSAGQVTSTIDPEGNTSSTIYNEIGKPYQTTDKLGNVSATIYDDRGNVIESQYPDNTVSRTVYDDNGRTYVTQDRHVIGETANGSRTIYNAIGQVVKSERLANVVVNIVTNANSTKSEFIGAGSVISSSSSIYDAAGRVLKSTDATGAITRYEYDKAGRTLAVIDALANRTEYIYDNAGRQTAMIDALGRTVSYEYDALGRRIRTNFENDTFTSVVYNILGQKITETDQAGLSTQFEYDAQGRLAKVIKPEVLNPESGNTASPQYSYSYDQYGRLSKITDPKARATTFAYDALGRQLTRTLPMGQSESQSYNTLGQLATKTDFKGILTEFTYDNFGRTEYKTHSFGGASETIQFTYDTLGRQNEIIEARGTTTYSYDNFSRMTKISAPEGDVNYEYDSVTSRKTRAYSANTDTSYDYDTLGRLATVTDSHGATTYNYTKVGSRSDVTLPNGAKTVYQYDNLNRLTNLTNKNSSNDILSSYTYSLAPNGRRTAVAEQTLKDDNLTFSNRNIAYTYDGLNRLTKEVSECADNADLQFTDEYTYDLVGNRTQKVHTADVNETIGYTFNNNDQLTLESSNAKGDTNYTYDANGSQIGKSSTNAVYTFGYNLQNRLASATINRMEGVSSVDIQSNYVYNQSGIRVRSNSTQIVDGVSTNKNRIFLLDSGMTGYSQILEELDAVGGTLVKSYTLADDVISQSSALGVRHFAYDGHGSTRLLTNSSSAITDRFDYDAYGIQLGQVPNVTNVASTNLLYSGEQFDPNLQMQYLRARYYDQNNGRFNRLDPFAGNNDDPQSLHKYGYCHGDSINGVDPSGNMTLVEMTVVMSIGLFLMATLSGCSKSSKSKNIKNVTIHYFYQQSLVSVITPNARKETEAIFKRCFDKKKAKRHNVSFKWYPNNTPNKLGLSKNGNSTDVVFYLYVNNKMTMTGNTHSDSTISLNLNMIRQHVIDLSAYRGGYTMDLAMAASIAHESGLHGIAGTWGHPPAVDNKFIDSSIPYIGSGGEFSDETSLEICDELDIDK